MGIEPTSLAWKAKVIPIYDTRKFQLLMVEGEGFEPSKAEPPDLQSGPFDRLGTPPERAPDSAENGAPCQCAKRVSAK